LATVCEQGINPARGHMRPMAQPNDLRRSSAFPSQGLNANRSPGPEDVEAGC
jgi:hypothetical protein